MAKSPTFIYKFQMEDTSLCDELIEYHKNAKEYKRAGSTTFGYNSQAKKSTDVGVFLTSNNPCIQKYNMHIMQAVNGYKEKYKYMANPVELSDVFNIQHYKPNEGFFEYHCERNTRDDTNRALVFMTYLNDVTDGGETEFYYQGVKAKPKKGLTLIWPTDFTHTHRGVTSKTQHKYIATGWFDWPSVATTINICTK